jgi:hypothetical protein
MGWMGLSARHWVRRGQESRHECGGARLVVLTENYRVIVCKEVFDVHPAHRSRNLPANFTRPDILCSVSWHRSEREFHEVLGEKKMMYLNEACSELARNQVYPQAAREECLVEVPAD